MMCFGNSLSDRGSLYNVVAIVSFGLYNPPEKLVNYAKVKKAVPLQAKSSRLWDDTVDLMSPLRQNWQSPQVKESLNLLATEYRVQCAFHGFMYLYSVIDVYSR